MSQFDPDSFLDATLSEPTVKRPPLPVGDYVGQIGEIKGREWKGVSDPSKSGYAWDVPIVIQVPPEVQSALGLELATLTLRDSIMIDTTPQGTIDNSLGKNGQLRRYREATDMNKPGDSFSARKMQGAIVTVKIKHDLYQGEPVERIAGVTKPA